MRRDWQPRAGALAADLAGKGAIADPAWRSAFEHTPRHAFVPRVWALERFNAPVRLVDGADPAQRERWLAAAYRDESWQ